MRLTEDHNLGIIYQGDYIRKLRSHDRLFYRNIDCRYLETFKRLKNKFKATFACSHEQCPVIRRRMEYHMMRWHCSTKNARISEAVGSRRPTEVCGGCGLSDSQNNSGQTIAPKAVPSTHTLLSPIGRYKDIQSSNYPNTDYFSDKAVSYSGVSVRLLDTNVEDTLKTELKDELLNIFENIPLNPKNKDIMLNALADDISSIVLSDDLDTDDKIKAEIDIAVNRLLMNHPASKLDKYKLVGDTRARLFDVVKYKQQDIIKKGDRNIDGVCPYSNVCNMYEENGFNKALCDLTDPIKKLFENYPIHTGTKLSKEDKDNLLNNLIDDMNELARNTTMSDAEKKVELEKILDDLHSKYPEPTDSVENKKYKNEIRDKLLDMIIGKPKDLTDSIKKLFENYPIRTGTKLSKEAKDKLLNNLIDDISQIANSKTTANTNKKVEIDKLLDDFHIKYPEPTNDKEIQKEMNEIREQLFDLIKVNPKGSKKTWEVANNDDSNFSGPSGMVSGAGSSSGRNSGFVTGSRCIGNRTFNRNFGGSNMVHNSTTNRLYGGGTDNDDSEAGSSGARGVNGGAIKSGTIGNGVGPNDGVFGGYSGGLNNSTRTINNRNDDPTTNRNLSQEVTKFFEDHPIFNQSPQSKDTKENTIRQIVEDVNKLASNNELNDDDIVNEVDKLVEKLHVRYPGHKSVQAKYKNEIKDKLNNMINNARDSNIGNRRNSNKDRKNKAGPSKTRPGSSEYDLKKSLNKALNDIAIYPQKKDEHRDSVIKNSFDYISWIADNVQRDNDDEINRELERALDKLHLWYPGAKRDQIEYKNDIKDRLFNVIKEYHKNQPISSQKNDCEKNKTGSPPTDETEESIISVSTYDSDSNNNSQDARSIKHWVNKLQHEKFMNGVDADELFKKLINRIIPILKSDNCCGKVTILKGAVLEIISEIPAPANCNNKLQRLVNDLVNNLYCRHKNDCCSSARSKRQTLYVDTFENNWKSNKLSKRNEFLDDYNNPQNHDVRNEIADVIMTVDEDPVNSPVECENHLENYIKKILENKTMNVSPSEVINTYKNVTKFLNNDDENYDGNDDGTYLKCPLTKNVSIYTSDTSCCATSTPKKSGKEKQKLNDEELKYINDLSKFIKAWMETLPVQFNSPEEKSFKDAVVAELAGEIMDNAKTAQITPQTKEVKDNYHKRLVYKWLYKLNVFDKDKMVPYVDDFLKKLEFIPVPVLTAPQQGTRQAMDNIKVREEQGWEKDFLPKGIDVLEDEISIWVNEQPSDMFNFNKKSRNNKIHNLAESLQTKLKNKGSESTINRDIDQWLSENIRKDKCKNIDEVKDSLKNRVMKLPGDATIVANYEEQERERAAVAELIEKQENEPQEARIDEDTMDIERTMKDYIVKFVDHHYDVDDPLAIRTFNYLLKSKLQRINPADNDEGCCPCSNEALPPQKLYEELELIKTISDWLKSIPLDEGYHTVGNRERIDLVLDLTRSIRAIEDEREEAPCAMDYEKYLATTIDSYLCNMPIIEGYGTVQNYATMIKQLLHRVSVWRELIAKKKIDKSLDSSGINDENIGDFIEEFIRHHGTEIANDEVKMEAWSIRLLREIKIIIRNAPDPKIVTKSQVYNKLASVPIPSDDTVERFDRELVYIEEITCWMKNIPLLPIDEEAEEEKQEEEEENRRIMICDLAETMAEKKNLANDAEFKEYLTKWIEDLPLDETREINIPFLITQLIQRIERTTKDDDVVIGATDSKTVTSKTSLKSKTHSKRPSKQAKNPGTMAINAIEKWCNSLPIKSDEAAKGNIERKLYQKVGEFNSDPFVYHDDLLYQTLLTVEVDEILEKIPVSDKLQKTIEQKNKELVKTLVDARKMAKEKGAGDDYKHRLERTIDASIPSPVTPKQVFDPAFEIYKSRLADMFILDNFDHSNDEVRMKYERRIKDEIDKYFDSAGKRNATRLTKHEIYNELYSALFKVPIPNENSVMEEVEQIKTRCVIDAWVEQLPLIHNDNFYEQLEFDKKVELLAKRIHEIEKLPKSEEKLKKKISKWLTSVPLQQGIKLDFEKYTDKLMKELKASKGQRKCVTDKKGKSKAKIKQKKTKHNESQIPGPSTHDVSLQPSSRPQPKKAADLIVDTVEEWSYTLPLSPYRNIDTETMRNDVVRKLLIKISDINTNPDIFNSDHIYKDILDEELDKIFSEIPKCCDFEANDKAQMKSTLIDAVTALKPLIKKEKNRFDYKHELNSTVDRILEKSDNLSCNKQTEFEAVKEDIVENFVQIHYDKDDYEGRQEYKEKVHDAVVKFLTKIAGEKNHNPQIRTNQLLSDLAKVPVPNNDVLKDEVEEIRMKNEISEFFDVNNVKQPKDKSIHVIKMSLAKKLCNIEKGGHNRDNDDKMKNEIYRTLKKLNKELKPRTIEGFVNKLKANESIRKRKVTKDDTVYKKSRSRSYVKTKPIPCSDTTCPHKTSKYDTAKNTNREMICEPTCPSKVEGQNINEICNDTCPYMSNEPQSCSDATCPYHTLDGTAKNTNKDNTCEPTCPSIIKTQKTNETGNNTCSRIPKKPKPCRDAMNPDQTFKDDSVKGANKDNVCKSTCSYKVKTQKVEESCEDTCPRMSKKLKSGSDDNVKDTNKRHICESTCPRKIEINKIDKSSGDTCPRMSKKPKRSSADTAKDTSDDTCESTCPSRIKTNKNNETSDDTRPRKSKKQKRGSVDTANDTSDDTCEPTCPSRIKTNKNNETSDDTRSRKSKKQKRGSVDTANETSDDTCEPTCPSRIKTNKNNETSDDTRSRKSKKQKRGSVDTANETSDDTCEPTCPSRIKTNKNNETSDDTRSRKSKKQKRGSVDTANDTSDDTCEPTCPSRVKTNKNNETSDDARSRKSKKQKRGSVDTSKDTSDDTCESTCPSKTKTNKIEETSDDNHPRKSKKQKRGSVDPAKDTNRDHVCESISPNKIKTNKNVDTCDETCPRKLEISKTYSDVMNPNRRDSTQNEDKACKQQCPRCIFNKKLQTDPIHTKATQTINRHNNENFESTDSQDFEETGDEGSDSDGLQEGGCPCQRQMMEMWRQFMAAARRCEGADDPFCAGRDVRHLMMAPRGEMGPMMAPRREVGPMGPMMAPLRR